MTNKSIRDYINLIENLQREGVAEGLNEFASNDSGDDRTYEYEVYQCNPDDEFDWIGGPIYKTDDMGKAHGIAYNLHKKHPNKAFMIWQERSQGSRGGYGIKDDEQGVAEGSESDAYGNTGEKHECGSCDGTGIDTYNDECPECGGKGWVRDKEE